MITIISKYGSLTVKEGREPGYRLVWRAPGLDVYVKGAISEGNLFESAANLALNVCIDRHIPAISLRYQRGGKREQGSSKVTSGSGKTLF